MKLSLSSNRERAPSPLSPCEDLENLVTCFPRTMAGAVFGFVFVWGGGESERCARATFYPHDGQRGLYWEHGERVQCVRDGSASHVFTPDDGKSAIFSESMFYGGFTIHTAVCLGREGGWVRARVSHVLPARWPAPGEREGRTE